MIDVRSVLERNYLITKSDGEKYKHIISDAQRRIDNNDFNFNDAIMFYRDPLTNKTIATYPPINISKKISAESVIILNIKNHIQKNFNLHFKSRNDLILMLFDNLHIVKNLSNWTIVRFDFKKYFYSISALYVYEKFISSSNLSRQTKYYLKMMFGKNNMYCVPGNPISNYLVEMISQKFDEEMMSTFSKLGILYYARYVDDGIIILKEHVSKNYTKKIINLAISKTFKDKQIKNWNQNKVSLNMKKFKVINSGKKIIAQNLIFWAIILLL